MAFRIRHIPTGRFLKKRCGSIWYTCNCIFEGDIINSTTTATGHLYATRPGAQKALNFLLEGGFKKMKNLAQPNDWEIVEG